MKTFHIWGGVIRGMISEVIRLEFSPADQQISAHLFASELEDEGHLAQLQARLAAHANVITPPLTIQAMPLLEPGMKMSLDVPLTVGMLAATRVLASRLSLDASLWLGTIAPDGSLPPLRGVLPLVLAAREQGLCEAYVPAANALEAALDKGMTVYPLASLSQLVEHLRGEQIISPLSRNYSRAVACQTGHGDCRSRRPPSFTSWGKRCGEDAPGHGLSITSPAHDTGRAGRSHLPV